MQKYTELFDKHTTTERGTVTEQNVETNPADPTEDGGNQPETERGSLLRKAYGAATTRLREQYRSEFDALYSQEAQALGVDYQPKPTPEQKAEQDLAELLAKFPHLRDKVTADQATA